MYQTVSADDIDHILDEIEHNERKQRETHGKIKGKLSKSSQQQSVRRSKSPSRNNKSNHQRGSSATISTTSNKRKQKGVHVHGPHCTHCQHNHHNKSSSKNKARRPGMWQSIMNTFKSSHSDLPSLPIHDSFDVDDQGRAGSEPVVDINGGIPWQVLTNPIPTKSSSRSGKKTQAENINMIRKIIASDNIDINTQNPRDGTTLIMHAIIIGDFNLFQELLKNGANYLIHDFDGDDCIDYALLFQRYKMCHLLLMINKRLTDQRIYEITRKWGKECRYMGKNVFG